MAAEGQESRRQRDPQLLGIAARAGDGMPSENSRVNPLVLGDFSTETRKEINTNALRTQN